MTKEHNLSTPQETPASSPGDSKLREQLYHFGSWVGDLLGRSTAFVSSSSSGQLLAALVFALIIIYYSGLWAPFANRSRDFNFLFNPDGEGVIIVDAPQIFTRERLLNDRLLESEWIDDQIKGVDDKLRNGEFGKPSTLELTELLLRLKLGAGSAGQKNQDTLAGDSPKSPTRPNIVDTSAQGVYQLLREANELSAPPLEAFEAASDFREYLSQQRYATILDDAHDLGENTLHRLNFHLTVVPARSSTDSLAAVSVRMSETLDHSRVLDMYSRLMVELRKKMQESVEQVFLDKSLIFDNNFPYRLDPTEETIISSIIEKKLNQYEGSVNINEAFSVALKEDVAVKRTLLEKRLREEIIKRTGASGFISELIKKSGENSAIGAAALKIGSDCQAYTLEELFDTPAGSKELQLLRKRLDLLKSRIDKLRGTAAQGDKEDGGHKNEVSPLTVAAVSGLPKPDKDLQILQDEYNFLSYRLSQDQISVNCWDRWNSATAAKLRLIGILYHVKLFGSEASPVCGILEKVTKPNLVSILLGMNGEEPTMEESAPRDRCERLFGHYPLVPPRFEPSFKCMTDVVSIVLDRDDGKTSKEYRKPSCRNYTHTADYIRSRLDETGAEIGRTGLVIILKEFLEKRLMETTLRSVTLGNFFTFSIDSCTFEHCQIRVRTLSESTTAATDLNGGLPSEVGRREALRLFLQLTCFASVRSYTVSPRAGERGTTVQAERKSMDGGFAGYLAARGEVQVDRAVASRRDQDHIFGIGDWGNYGRGEAIDRYAVTTNEPCTPELMDVLAQYPVKIEFSKYIQREIEKEKIRLGGVETAKDGHIIANAINFLKIVLNIEAKEEKKPGPLQEWWKKYVVDECARLTKARKLRSPDCKAPDIQTLAAIAVSQRARTASVGWIVSPWTDGSDAYQKTLSQPLSALVSLPSWWARLNLEVTTCWVRARRLRGDLAPGSLCENAKGSQTHMIELPLPGKAQEVLQKLGFFIIRTPYIDIAQRTIKEPVEAGRTARIRLIGGRLWKNPRVRLGSQWHDRIEVLPNMQGLIATFDCVEPSTYPEKQIARFDAGQPMSFQKPQGTWERSGNSKEDNSGTGSPFEYRDVQVWTSEGVTATQSVQVLAFRPRHIFGGELERPCWPMEPKPSDRSEPVSDSAKPAAPGDLAAK